MTSHPTGSRIAGVLRVIGFFTLIFVMTPFHLALRPFHRIDPFLLPRLFHILLMRLLGFKVRVHGDMLRQRPGMFVANHASYLDVPVLGSVIPAAFVAKSEVAGWPVIGILAKLQHTVFIERRSARAIQHRDSLNVWLQRGESLTLFPEGTSTDGTHVLRFKSSLFSVVEPRTPSDPAIPVQPVSIACTGFKGQPLPPGWRDYYAWYGDMTLPPHLWRVFCLGGFTVEVLFHPPVTLAQFGDRKALADYCQRTVAGGLAQLLGLNHAEKPLAVARPDLQKTGT